MRVIIVFLPKTCTSMVFTVVDLTVQPTPSYFQKPSREEQDRVDVEK